MAPKSQKIRWAIDTLEGKNRWTAADYAEARTLRAEYHEAVATERAA